MLILAGCGGGGGSSSGSQLNVSGTYYLSRLPNGGGASASGTSGTAVITDTSSGDFTGTFTPNYFALPPQKLTGHHTDTSVNFTFADGTTFTSNNVGQNGSGGKIFASGTFTNDPTYGSGTFSLSQQ
ncbi:MAG: hypothetical protein JO250_16575 [Armatimonadetes bacterium]|nr:hypothetical protein [Armatimonadota bacterium]